ncbi:hypothetical protein GCM10012284_30560 [Mangrovihabitans endophyticus]|uniref:Uncharacterized protein n=1 Tax=Mangrovihabitans endophyticus TaxID=1751298 RepID=A0A8J3FNM2_9ACTN|nr:hypothetical protein GCM10012284_30560 [Mangrovihabitans endophyticus]
MPIPPVLKSGESGQKHLFRYSPDAGRYTVIDGERWRIADGNDRVERAPRLPEQGKE